MPADSCAELPRLQRPKGRRPGIGIVHLGLGAFFRAHGAIYTAQAMAVSGGDWGIVGVSLRHPDQRDRLAPQGFAYSSVTLSPDGATADVVGVIENLLVAPEDPVAVLRLLADPAIRIVSLTITEKGYCHSPATGELNADHPDILQDLADPAAPRSGPGFLVRALQARHSAGQRPFTVLCCDNLPENGKIVRKVVLGLAHLIDAELAAWIESECTFPCTMVDRIVPATTEADIARVCEITGRYDMSPVMHEPFRQWVIEDYFVDGARPDFAAARAQMVSDVTPFELMKLRCLNGTHSSLAYLGYLAGYETISEAVTDQDFAGFLEYLWRAEIVPSLEAPPDTDLVAYTAALLERFRNPAIRHRTWQIAMDGSQKLPQRLLATAADNLRDGRPVAGIALAVAAWMRYVGGVDEKGAPIDVRDPLADRLKAASNSADTPEGKVAALLSVTDVFPRELAKNERFASAVTAAYGRLAQRGARAGVAEFEYSNAIGNGAR